ncbi:MAG: helix-turn-helix domain-containing protein [Pseudomonadota bacterium]
MPHKITTMSNEFQAAEQLGLAVATLRRWRWAGKGPKFRKLGAAVRYSEADLLTFIEQAGRTSTSDPGPVAGHAE